MYLLMTNKHFAEDCG